MNQSNERKDSPLVVVIVMAVHSVFSLIVGLFFALVVCLAQVEPHRNAPMFHELGHAIKEFSASEAMFALIIQIAFWWLAAEATEFQEKTKVVLRFFLLALLLAEVASIFVWREQMTGLHTFTLYFVGPFFLLMVAMLAVGLLVDLVKKFRKTKETQET